VAIGIVGALGVALYVLSRMRRKHEPEHAESDPTSTKEDVKTESAA
jgi:hypothetical protein